MTIKRGLMALSLVLLGWVAVMAVMMRISDAAPAAVVFFLDDSVIKGLPAEAAILSLGRYAMTVSNAPGTVEGLYGAGAYLVLPAGLTGCLPLTKAQRTRL